MIILTSPFKQDNPKIHHGFFGRIGGVSSGDFESLNCNPKKDVIENVLENRARVARALSVDSIVYPKQVHGTNVAVVESPWDLDDAPVADALVTKTPGITLGVVTADCTPVLFWDPVAGVIGSAHSGWRGALAGINEAAISAMISLGATVANIRASLGPTIYQKSYEMGPEVLAEFVGKDPAYGEYFKPDTNHFDLPGFVVDRLWASGIRQIHAQKIDTYTDDRFFSYRRQTHKGRTTVGAQASAIGLKG